MSAKTRPVQSPKRERLDSTFQVRMPSETKARLEIAAARDHRTPTAQVRMFIEQGLQRIEQDGTGR